MKMKTILKRIRKYMPRDEEMTVHDVEDYVNELYSDQMEMNMAQTRQGLRTLKNLGEVKVTRKTTRGCNIYLYPKGGFPFNG